jgi:DNA polymerase-3 subunit epsilon
MTDFAAIDFETANYNPSSICSVGVVIVRNGEILDKIYRLIRPEPEWYSYWNTRLFACRTPRVSNGLSRL